MAWATPTHGFASGESETLVETSDGGGTWHKVNLGIAPSDPFYNVYCRDADNCFVIGNGTGNGPDHWRTTNGGVTWQQITNFPNGGSWRQIDFVSASVGFMGSNGAYGTHNGCRCDVDFDVRLSRVSGHLRNGFS